LEVKQKRVKLVDASDMAVRVHEKAVSAEEGQEWQVHMESVGHKNGSLERTSGWNGSKPWRKRGKIPHRRGENGCRAWRQSGKCPIAWASGKKKMNLVMMMMVRRRMMTTTTRMMIMVMMMMMVTKTTETMMM
jgi:hypothetical protein